MMPPALLICPDCRTVCLWNNHRNIMLNLEMGNEFVLLYCPACQWCVVVPDDYEEEESEADYPF